MDIAVKTERTWTFVMFMLYHLLNISIIYIEPVSNWFSDEYSLTILYILFMPYIAGLITILGTVIFIVDRSWKYLLFHLLGGSVLLVWYLKILF